MKHRHFFLTLALGILMTSLTAQETTNVDPSAALEVDSTTKGFLPPRMTTLQRNAISSPAAGLLIFNTTTDRINYYSGNSWVNLAPAQGAAGVLLSSTGQFWMDKNLGAGQIATSSTDANSYGFLYQWGRNTDGHQLRTPSTAAGPVVAGTEGSDFITSSGDWLTVQDDTRWNGSSKGVHDPCPDGFRVPTEAELNSEQELFPSNNATGAFESALKLSVAGIRNGSNAALSFVGSYGFYWSSTVDGTSARYLYFFSSGAGMLNRDRANGISVRCLQE